MVKVMKGFRVIEVAQFTFVPSAGGLLADWGADVIKVEHPGRGDAQRGFISWSGKPVDPDRNPMLEHSNRGKRSVGITLTGMGSDGVKGLAGIKAAGGTTLAQDEASSVIYGMNREAIEGGAVQQVLPLDEIAAAMVQLASGAGR